MAGGPSDTPERQRFRRERTVEFWVAEADRVERGERHPLTAEERADLGRAIREAEAAAEEEGLRRSAAAGEAAAAAIDRGAAGGSGEDGDGGGTVDSSEAMDEGE